MKVTVSKFFITIYSFFFIFRFKELCLGNHSEIDIFTLTFSPTELCICTSQHQLDVTDTNVLFVDGSGSGSSSSSSAAASYTLA